MLEESETVLLELCLSVFARKNGRIKTGENEDYLRVVLIFPRSFMPGASLKIGHLMVEN
jgi:hypothetical protein